jgi:PIN domain
MLHVLLNSTAYRQDPQRKKASFQTLGQLCEQHALTLHIPSIVRGEFISHFSDMAERTLEGAIRSVIQLQRINDPAQAKAVVDRILADLTGLRTVYAADITHRFDEWAKAIGASVDDVPANCLNDVLNQYFNGEGPFKKIKNRDDFPDAFIWQTVRQLAAQHNLFVVSDDNNFRKAIDEIPNVEVFENLDALIESEMIQELFPDNYVRKNTNAILRLIEEHKEDLEGELLDLLSAELARLHLDYRDDESADIVDVSEINNADFDFFRVGQYGPETFRIPFEATVEATVDHLLLKSTYYEMPESESDALAIQNFDWNEYYMHVTEEVELQVTGVIAIEIDTRALIATLEDGALSWQNLEYNFQTSLDQLDELKIKDA